MTDQQPTARAVVEELHALADPVELAKTRTRLDPSEPVIGVRMRSVFDVARTAAVMGSAEWELLVEEPTYEARMVAFAILDFQARKDPGSTALRDTYLGHHDRISTWDMVDRAAPRVVGSAVAGGPYDVLEELAGSADPLRRRSAITAPLWFTRYGEADDVTAGFRIAAILCADPDPSVHKAVGIYLAYAGVRDPVALETFLAEHAASMPAVARRLAVRKQ